MRYFVVSDTHSFYDETIKALTDAGFFTYEGEKKLVVCGDLMDRGTQSLKLQEFIMQIRDKGELIFIRGNHEDLMMEMLAHYYMYETSLLYEKGHHYSNGTYSTALQLTEYTPKQAHYESVEFIRKAYNSPFVSILINESVDYYETSNYIFVHGWIPYNTMLKPHYLKNWRQSTKEAWNSARWTNGLAAAVLQGIVEPHKTIVCGHWNCSYGHKYFENDPAPEFDPIKSNFSPFYADGIIAIDACTVLSGKVNCIVIDD